MTRRGSEKDINDKYRKFQIEQQIHDEYKEYLITTGMQGSPENAHLFAIKIITESGGSNYKKYNEIELILLLEGKLPAFY